MSWREEVEQIEARRRLALALGGAEAVARQHARGRADVRARIAALADAGSFRELGALAGRAELGADGALQSFEPAGIVVGAAKVAGRPVVIGGDDFTVRGGAYSAPGLRKAREADGLALRRRIPLLRLLEGGGASIEGATARRGQSGYDLTEPPPLNILAMQTLACVPVACAALGPCVGFPAARLAASHFSVMTPGAVVLTGGPALVERATGARIAKEELGGAGVHLRSGVVDNGAADEADALAQLRRFLSYLPQNAWQLPPRAKCEDPPERCDEELLGIIPRNRRKPYPVREVIARVLDRDSFFEIGARFGRGQVIGLARAAGHPVGVLASDCKFGGGGMSAQGARKIRRFVETCDTFNLPIVSFVDEPGFLVGAEAERAATIRFGMEAAFAVLQSRVPWIAVVLRRSFGVAQGIHFGPGCRVLAWPSMQSGALPVESGVHLAFAREIAAAPDPEAKRRELEDEMFAAQSVFPRAEEFGVHDLVDPRRTRPLICEWIAEIQSELQHCAGPRTYSPRP